MRAAVLLLMGGTCGFVAAERDSSELLTQERCQPIHELISPAEGESLFRSITWHTDFWEARKIAAREGKPIYIWAGSGGGPVGVC